MQYRRKPETGTGIERQSALGNQERTSGKALPAERIVIELEPPAGQDDTYSYENKAHYEGRVRYTLADDPVLGPEAPLIAIGGGLAALTVRLVKKDAPPMAVTIMASAGSFAAVSTLLSVGGSFQRFR